MKIYIAGRITGNELAYEQFKMAEEWLLKIGHAPLNPMKNLGFSYKDYIDMGLLELSKCDAIYVLNNDSEDSLGTQLEIQYAKTVGILILEKGKKSNEIALNNGSSVREALLIIAEEENKQWELLKESYIQSEK